MKDKIEALADKYYGYGARIDENEFKKDLHKLREEAVRGFAKYYRDNLYAGKTMIIQNEAETYLQSLDKGDGE